MTQHFSSLRKVTSLLWTLDRAMAVGPVVRARHGRESSAEMRPLKNRDPEDPSSGGKEAGDTLLLGIPSNKRLALLITAVALVCLLFFMSGRSDDDGDLAERRAGGSERLDHSPLLSDGFGRTAVAPLPHTTGTGKGSYGGVQAADASSSLHHLPSPSAASSSLHRSSSAPSAPGRAPSPKAAPSPKTENSLGTGASKKGTLLNSVHGIADSKKKLMPPAEQDDDDDDEESPLDENEDEDEEGQGIDEDDEDDEDDQDDDEIVEHEDEDDKRSEEEMTEYANVMFDKMDKNENDRVSWKEYHKVIKNDVDFEDETTAEQREDFDEIDANKDGYISRDEMIRDWLRDDLDYGDVGDDENEDDEDDEDDDDADVDEGNEDGGVGKGEGKVGASKDSTLPTAAKSKAAVGAKASAAGGGVGGAGKATSEPSAGRGKTLGESIKDVALKMFRGRVPKPRSINVMLYQANQVSWMAADEHCRKQHKKICPMKAIQQLKLCKDKDPKHKGRSTPLDRPGSWVTLDTCKEEQHGGDATKKALIACC